MLLECGRQPLPRMQALRPWLSKLQVDLGAGVRGVGCKDKLFISHRWETPNTPDTKGVQQRAIQRHLRSHPEIKFVWYDFWCVDGRDEFDRMLEGIADLYLTSKCTLCGESFKGYGHNARPVRDEGVACDECNAAIVVPQRFRKRAP